MQTFIHEDYEWPLTIKINGKTLSLHLLDEQIGESHPAHQASSHWHPNSIKWLTPIYKEI